MQEHTPQATLEELELPVLGGGVVVEEEEGQWAAG